MNILQVERAFLSTVDFPLSRNVWWWQILTTKRVSWKSPLTQTVWGTCWKNFFSTMMIWSLFHLMTTAAITTYSTNKTPFRVARFTYYANMQRMAKKNVFFRAIYSQIETGNWPRRAQNMLHPSLIHSQSKIFGFMCMRILLCMSAQIAKQSLQLY